MGRPIVNRIKEALPALVGSLTIAYFAYHFVSGDRGLIGFVHLKGEIRRAEATLESVRERKSELVRLTAGLQEETLDRDLLEERARVVLGYGYKSERLIPMRWVKDGRPTHPPLRPPLDDLPSTGSRSFNAEQ